MLVGEASFGYDSQRDQEHLAQLQQLERGVHHGMSKRTMEPSLKSREVKTAMAVSDQSSVSPSQVSSSPPEHMAQRGEAPSRSFLNEQQDSLDSSDDSEDDNNSSLPPHFQRKEFLEQQRSIMSQIGVTAEPKPRTPPESTSSRQVTNSQGDSFPRQSDKFLAQQESIMKQIRANTATTQSVRRYDSSAPVGTRQGKAASRTVSLPSKNTVQPESNSKTVTSQVASSLPPMPMEQHQAPGPTASQASSTGTPRASSAAPPYEDMKISEKAITSLVLSIFGLGCVILGLLVATIALFPGIVLGLISVIMAVLAKRDIIKQPAKVGGGRMATAGLIIGIIGFVSSFGLLLLVW